MWRTVTPYRYINKLDIIIPLQLKLGKDLALYVYDIYNTCRKNSLINEQQVYYKTVIMNWAGFYGKPYGLEQPLVILENIKCIQKVLGITDLDATVNSNISYSINRIRHNKRHINYIIKLLDSDTFIQGIDKYTIHQTDIQENEGDSIYTNNRLIYSWAIENQHNFKKVSLIKKVRAINEFCKYYIHTFSPSSKHSNPNIDYDIQCNAYITLYRYYKWGTNPLFGFVIDDEDNVYWSWDD